MKPAAETPAFQPLYRQIKTLITRSLVSGEWRPGESIPSEVELAGRYSVSQGTVRKAVGELAEERLLVRQQGKGTFVASYAGERSQFPFLRITPDAGPLQELTAELLDLQRVRDPASARVPPPPAASTCSRASWRSTAARRATRRYDCRPRASRG
jgi:GntR family transcriptional regulator